MPSSFLIKPPPHFSFSECMDFMRRSPRELLHECHPNSVRKALPLGNEAVVVEVKPQGRDLKVLLLVGPDGKAHRQAVRSYVENWLDLKTDLRPFYRMARQDSILKELIVRHRGYRMIGMPDLYESLVWAILGQQINLAFAYTLKARVVERHGRVVMYEGRPYHLFPTPHVMAEVDPAEWLPLQFSRQKATYVHEVSKAFASGRLSAQQLEGLPLEKAKEILMQIKGIGNWTANYALMKTFRYPDALPLEDAGLRAALRQRMGLKKNPSTKQIARIFRRYKGWEAYATLYLWKSLG